MRRLLSILRQPRASLALLAMVLGACAGAASRQPTPSPHWTEAQKEEAFLFCAPRLKDYDACRCFAGALEYFSAGEAPTRESVALAFGACGPLA